MKLRIFRAPSMHQALAKVKSQIGPHAVIVRTRTFKTGSIFGLGGRIVVEVTARPENSSVPALRRIPPGNRVHRAYIAAGASADSSTTPVDPVIPAYSPAGKISRTNNRSENFVRKSPATVNRIANLNIQTQPIPTQPASADEISGEIKSQITDLRQLVENLVREQRQLHTPEMPENLFDVYLELIQSEVADEIARDLIEKTQKQMPVDQLTNINLIRRKIADVMDRMINTAGPIARNLDTTARVVALIGPTGVGKTTTIAKLAANFKLRQNKKVGLITIDTYRIGAVDQLRMYAEILDVPLKVVLTPPELTEAVEMMREMDIVLIDTAGRSQNDQIKLRELQTFLTAASPHEVHLVLSSTAHHSHMLSAAEKFNTLGVDRVIFTKLDEAISFGVVLSVIRKLDASLSYITTGQNVPDDIEVGNGQRLAKLLLKMENLDEQAETSLPSLSST
ncbi:MAG: flagellar biosynthesis protein FlhF [Sedimentisphaerales bacterium]|nr:flagellar biosynthesis protein FlhF [Sedimentisphaerales bacterium]